MKRKLTGLMLITVILVTMGCSPSGNVAGTTETTTAQPTTATTTSAPTTTSSTTSATTAATTTTPSTTVVKFQAASPVSIFTEEDIEYLGLNCSGSDQEIAACISQWQQENMTYGGDGENTPDVSDAIHWNYFLPGIYTSRDIIYNHVSDGKPYGICFDFAVVYASIAEYYGLEVRVMNTISKPSDSNPNITFTTGMAPEEYERLNVKLTESGLDYPYDAVRLVAEETPTHYWAEIKINGEWTSFDATGISTGNDNNNVYYETNDYEVTDWLSRDKSALLEEYTQRIANGERLPEPEQTQSTQPDEDYEGITDELGQTNRAANIDDLIAGLAPAPYFADAADAVEFMNASSYLTATDITEANEDKELYESCSGENFYLVCYFICDGDSLSGQAWIDAYERYSGETLDTGCAAAIISDD